jgi:pimeloyl-ACP methyl ester carboxylesterase
MIITETWQHRDIITNGIRMHYVIQGSGPLVVLLHGFPEFWYSWRHQIPVIAKLGYTVVAPDLRGYNETDKPRGGYSVTNLLRDIVGLIKGLDYEHAVIVGHDWGGVLAWAFAMRYPQMTTKLIGLNAPPPWTFARELRTIKQLRKSWYVFFFQLPWLPEYMLARKHGALLAQTIYSTALRKAAFPSDVLDHYRDAMCKPGALTAALNYYRALVRTSGNPFNPGVPSAMVSAPTLLIWGVQDSALDIAMTYGLEEWVPDLRIERIAESGHWVQQEQPEAVNRFMVDFLRR